MGSCSNKQRLSKEDLDYLHAHIGHDKNTIKEWYKDFMKDCPNGMLTRIEFVNICKTSTLFPSQKNAEELCHCVFRGMDRDSNGFIDFKEFILSVNFTNNGSAEEKLKWAFRIYDIDGNGVIDQQEMTQIVQAVCNAYGGCEITAGEMANNIFTRMDKNNDGHITEEEFLVGCLQDDTLFKMLAGIVLQ